MAILAISKLGNPILRQKALPLTPAEIKKAAFQQLIDDMFETMYDEPGIGLAAPQVGRSQQLVVMDCPGEGGLSQDGAHQSDDPVLRARAGRRMGRLLERRRVARQSDASLDRSSDRAGSERQSRSISKPAACTPSVFNMSWTISSASCSSTA
jgi:hypothetical protein